MTGDPCMLITCDKWAAAHAMHKRIHLTCLDGPHRLTTYHDIPNELKFEISCYPCDEETDYYTFDNAVREGCENIRFLGKPMVIMRDVCELKRSNIWTFKVKWEKMDLIENPEVEDIDLKCDEEMDTSEPLPYPNTRGMKKFLKEQCEKMLF